jgi:hypothetical protein
MSNKETIPMTRFTILYRRGFGPGSPQWSFPNYCACCGAASIGFQPMTIKHTSGNMKYSLKFKVPYCATCLIHVQARARDAQMATIAAILVGVPIVFAVAWFAEPHDNGFSAWLDGLGRGWGFFGAIMVGLVAGAGVKFGLVNLLANRSGQPLASCPQCTVPLEAELKTVNARLLGRSDLGVLFTCASPVFASQFREKNREIIDNEVSINGTIIRSPRGDARLPKSISDEFK